MKLFEKEKKVETKALPMADLKYLNIENIKYAPYQRELNENKVEEIVKGFLPDIADYPLISMRRGEFWCVDGQHIIKALLKMGYTNVPCRVIAGLTYEQECLRFIILNTGRTKLNANQIFHGRVEEKDSCAVALVKMFEKYGFSYNKNSCTRGENLIGTVNSFVYIYKKCGMDMVERVLKILRKAWFGEKDSLLASVINGLKTFLNEYPDANDKIIISALEKISPKDLEDDAKDSKKVKRIRNPRAGSTCYHVAKIINELYTQEYKKVSRKLSRELNEKIFRENYEVCN